MSLKILLSELKSLENPVRAKNLSWFFKTGPGQYGEGDKFLGLTNPQVHTIVKKYQKIITLSEVMSLLQNPYHECRLTALLLLVYQFAHGDNRTQKLIYILYLSHVHYINNWDLVDLSAPRIIGAYCFEQSDYSILYSLSLSSDLWEKRISIISTLFLIKYRVFTPTLTIAKTLLKDPHDLIHKAVGWMLREVGKKDQKVLIKFLDKHTLHMPRTMLRYSIEKFPENLRQHYLRLS